MNKYNGILFGNEKEQNTNRCCDMDGPWNQKAKCKKLVSKDHVLYNFIYIKYPE